MHCWPLSNLSWAFRSSHVVETSTSVGCTKFHKLMVFATSSLAFICHGGLIREQGKMLSALPHERVKTEAVDWMTKICSSNEQCISESAKWELSLQESYHLWSVLFNLNLKSWCVNQMEPSMHIAQPQSHKPLQQKRPLTWSHKMTHGGWTNTNCQWALHWALSSSVHRGMQRKKWETSQRKKGNQHILMHLYSRTNDAKCTNLV